MLGVFCVMSGECVTISYVIIGLPLLLIACRYTRDLVHLSSRVTLHYSMYVTILGFDLSRTDVLSFCLTRYYNIAVR